MRKDRPSRTAYKVALNIVTLGAKEEMREVLPPGIVDATMRLLLASGAATERTIRWTHSRRMVRVYEAFDWMLPGQFEAFGHRKAFCQRQVTEGIADGVTQVLVLGAGYDTLGWRLAPEFPGVNFFEIDHPATMKSKARGVEAMGERDNLILIPADLGKRTLADTLTESKLWNHAAQAVIIAEGLVMYLPGGAVRDMFRQCAAVTGAGSRIAFSYIPSGADGRPDVGRSTGLMLWLQRVVGEPWIWSIRPEELRPFLAASGWTNAPEPAGPAGKHGVEFFAVATR